jgi:hypothetical protein
LVDEGYRCPACGGEVAHVPSEQPVAVGEGDSGPGEVGSRRFER